jgi:SAM-dependent methyltransferase
MIWHRLLATAALGLAFACGSAAAQQYGDKEYQPHVGQQGKDVIWVPTPNELIARMLDMAQLTATDIHFDLGSGDGRTVIAAARRGAQSTGVEFNPDMVALSDRNAQTEGVADKARFINGDIFQTDFSKASVVTLYLLPSLNLKLRPTLLGMKPGTRVVSHAFTMGDWEPDQTATVESRTAYLWIVPAKVDGTWRVDGAGDLVLTQRYQKVEGTLGGKPVKVTLRGDTITVVADGKEYAGRVEGTHMRGTIKGGAAWSATRAN